MGGSVESLVKQAKNMIQTSVGKNVLNLEEFLFLLMECKMLINKRPIAYKNLNSDMNLDSSVTTLTPEMLIRGFDVPSLQVVPQIYVEDESDSESYANDGFEYYKKLRKVVENLKKIYYDEFLYNLRYQSANKADRYKKVLHMAPKIGDLVCVKNKFSKPFSALLGIVTSVEFNNLNEVVAVIIRKSNGENLRRHVTDVVLLEQSANIASGESTAQNCSEDRRIRSVRKAALRSSENNRNLADLNLI